MADLAGVAGVGEGEGEGILSDRRGGPSVAPRKGDGPTPSDVECEKCRGGEGVGEGLVRIERVADEDLSRDARLGDTDERACVDCLGAGVGDSPRAAVPAPDLKGDLDT